MSDLYVLVGNVVATVFLGFGKGETKPARCIYSNVAILA